jgi:hypothetical protein
MLGLQDVRNSRQELTNLMLARAQFAELVELVERMLKLGRRRVRDCRRSTRTSSIKSSGGFRSAVLRRWVFPTFTPRA